MQSPKKQQELLRSSSACISSSCSMDTCLGCSS